MNNFETYKGAKPAWCPGCGNFAILNYLKRTLVELGIAPHQFTIVSGAGQAAKLPHYIKCNSFKGLHGRTLPLATGIRLANHDMHVLAISGDGDCYGEGGNHLLQAIRRYVGVKLFVHNNQVMGLSRGQASPTTRQGAVTTTQAHGAFASQLNPLALAISLDCSFVARGFAGASGLPFLKEIMKKAIRHEGFALVDILQNCVTYNKVNTFHWYKDRVYQLEKEYDPYDRVEAFSRSLEWGDKIPTGIFYLSKRDPYEKHIPALEKTTLVNQAFSKEKASLAISEFF